jgi:hypothetical protein
MGGEPFIEPPGGNVIEALIVGAREKEGLKASRICASGSV